MDPRIRPPLLLIRMPGLTCVINSARLFALSRRTLLVKVSATDTLGTIVIFEANAMAGVSWATTDVGQNDAQSRPTAAPATPHHGICRGAVGKQIVEQFMTNGQAD